jgi:cyclophilin family peptidyl-prolyl cis-trans isomerase
MIVHLSGHDIGHRSCRFSCPFLGIQLSIFSNRTLHATLSSDYFAPCNAAVSPAILRGMRLLSILFGWAWLIGVSLHAGTLAQFRMPVGEIDVELYDQDKPATVQNFIRYVQSGLYQDGFVHRWAAGFVIQGGGYYVTNRLTSQPMLAAVPTFDSITNEYGTGRTYSNTYGTIAMARVGGQTNSATSQWFFNLTNNAFLDSVDGGFTVFGRVVGGTNVLNRFNVTSAANGLYLINVGSPLDTLPVLSPNIATVPDLVKNLVYVDVTLLNVQVVRTARGHPQISWQSVSNKVNRVQFTTQMPPAWTELVSTNGTGATLYVTDQDAVPGARFYRVLVDY